MVTPVGGPALPPAPADDAASLARTFSAEMQNLKKILEEVLSNPNAIHSLTESFSDSINKLHQYALQAQKF